MGQARNKKKAAARKARKAAKVTKVAKKLEAVANVEDPLKPGKVKTEYLLHNAVEKLDLVGLKKLLKGNYDPNQLDTEAKTALQSAAKLGNMEMVKGLIAAGGDIDIPDHKGRTALQEATKKGHGDIMELLIKKGAKVDRLDSKGSSPLHEASKKGHALLVKSLMDKGAAVHLNTQNYKGISPLHEAARKGREEVAMHLLSIGADPNARDIHGNRPAVLAEAFGFPTVAKLLGGLSKEEKAEADKIAKLEDVKETAKEIARQQATDEMRLPSKHEIKSTSIAAMDVFLNSMNSEKGFDEVKATALVTAREHLTTFYQTHDGKGNPLTEEEIAAKQAAAAAAPAAEVATEEDPEMDSVALIAEATAEAATEEPAEEAAAEEPVEEAAAEEPAEEAAAEEEAEEEEDALTAAQARIAELEEEREVLMNTAALFAKERDNKKKKKK